METRLNIAWKSFQRWTCFLVQNFVLIHVIKKKKHFPFLIVWLKKTPYTVPLPGSSLLDALLLSWCRHQGCCWETSHWHWKKLSLSPLLPPHSPAHTAPTPPASTNALWTYDWGQGINTTEKWEDVEFSVTSGPPSSSSYSCTNACADEREMVAQRWQWATRGLWGKTSSCW